MKLEPSSESREVECAFLWKLNKHMVLVRYKDGVHLAVEDAKAVIDGCIDLMEGRKFLAVVDARNMGGTLAKKAGDYFAHDEKFNSYLAAQALVVNDLAIKLIARFFIKLNEPIRPTKIFEDIEDAMVWLESRKNLLE